ncbi:MAG: hypothetical protein ACOVS5_13070 [Oligoflexus sp.]|jgi:hypothetical protein
MRRWFFVLYLFLSPLLLAQTEERGSSEKGQLIRIGGQYRIQKIEKLGDQDFQITFQGEPATGRYDALVLRSDHIHVGVQEGQVLRLTAEVIKDSGPALEVTQVLLFLNHREYGSTPVWLLSKNHITRDFRGARWLEMHAPQADFLIL